MPNKLALLGLFILSYLLYRRLFKMRLPKEIIGGFTTHLKPNEPNYYKIADQKLDGTLGEQYLGAYKSPKIITGDIEIIRELPELQGFIDKHESLLHKIEESKKQALREERTSKQDSRFYNEDGTRDYENFPNK